MFDVDFYQSEMTMSVSRAWPMLVAGALLSLPAIAQEGGRPPEGGGRDRRPPNPLMQALDADGDGELSTKEIENAAVALKTLDKNKDGKLAGEEIRPAFGGGFPGGPGGGPGGPGGGRQFDPEAMLDRAFENDKNKDGKLTLEEIPEQQRRFMEPGFKDADGDKDGALSRDEMKKMFESFRERFRNGGGRPGGGQGAPGGAPGGRGARPAPEA
jgi:Ca2+-binding EF-hand superfamily protein